MPHRPLINGYDFAAAGAKLRGTWAIGDFQRLRDRLASADGTIEYSAEGVHDMLGRPALRLRLNGILQLMCQRCLKALDFPVSVDTTLVLARSEGEIDSLPDDAEEPDRIVAGEAMQVGELLEDELLLAVPYAPRHERCDTQGKPRTGGASSPFSELKSMLGTGGARQRKT